MSCGWVARYCCACNAFNIAPIRSWIRLIAFSGRRITLNSVILPTASCLIKSPGQVNVTCAYPQPGCPVLNLQTRNPVKVPAIGGDAHQPGRQRTLFNPFGAQPRCGVLDAAAVIAQMDKHISIEQIFHRNLMPITAARNSSVRLLPRLAAGVLMVDFLAVFFGAARRAGTSRSVCIAHSLAD